MPAGRIDALAERARAAARRRGGYLRSLLSRPDVVAPGRPAVRDAAVRLVIGPANFAGQAWTWARAVEAHRPDVAATVVAVRSERLDFPADYAVPDPIYRWARWSREQRRWIERHFSHVLLDGIRPLTGPLLSRDARRDAASFRKAGLRVGLIAHGSEVRLPSRHRELYPYSPFDPNDERTARYEAQAIRFGGVVARDEGPVFVSTPDQLDFAPRATWLPVVVDPAPWRSDHPVLERPRPVVVHVPSNPFLKGSALVDPVLARMHEQGRIDYRRLEGVAPAEMPALLADADVVLDQFVLGCYGVMAVQAMCAGRLVVAHVAEQVRARLPGLPIVESGPADVEEVLDQILAERDRFRAVAAHGAGFAAEVHDGRRSAQVLDAFLDSPAGPATREQAPTGPASHAR